MTREIPSGLISYVRTASWENPHPEKYRAQAATDGPFVRAPIHAPRWKRGCSLGGGGGWGGKERVEVIPCWNKSTFLSWGGSVGVPGAVGLLTGALPVCYLVLLAFLCCSAETAAVLAPQG